MKTKVMFGVFAALAVAGLVARGGAVEFKSCAKCPMRMRIAADGRSATVNLCRLQDDAPDAAMLERRKAAMLARAERLLVKDDPKAGALTRPLMGWSSWNTFGVDISEEIILGVARAMATNGLKAAGYTYVNIDDGFFWGHGEDGVLRFHPQRFPRGMKGTADGIHALGLKAGIYSDAGADTCGSMWGGSGSGGKDSGGVGGGLYGHDAADCRLHFNELGFDFIKVDYCGGGKLKLDERARYTEIANAIKATGRTDVRLNLCRWAFPGTWAADIAGSWRTTKDIRANWKSVRDLIEENLYLSAYASPGHYNDMDMLEVGQLKGVIKTVFGKHGDSGLTPDEELTHFGMWCMLSSPLLLGCDPRSMPESSFAVATNPYLLAMNQNDLGLQAYVAARDGDAYVLVKDADARFGTARYAALLNLGDAPREMTLRARDLDLAGRIEVFDLAERADPGDFTGEAVVQVPAHGAKFYRLDAERRVARTVYEAETAYLSEYQELRDAVKAGTAFPAQQAGAFGGVVVKYLGNRETNDLVWKDVQVVEAGDYDLVFDYVSGGEDRSAFLQVDGGEKIRFETKAAGARVAVGVKLAAGVHAVRISNGMGWAADFDRMTLVRRP